MTSWPLTLPQSLLLNGFVEQSADNLIASENSTGPAKLRRRTTASPSMLAGSMVLNSSQKAELKTFVRDSIGSCAKAFNFPDPDGGDPLLVRLKPNFSFVKVGSHWRVSLEFEVLP